MTKFGPENTIEDTKRNLRITMRVMRRSLDEITRAAAEESLCQNVLELLHELQFPSPRIGRGGRGEGKTRCVAVYLAKSPEASADAAIRVLISRNICVCAPRETDSGPQFVELKSLEDIQVNARGVRESQGENIVEFSQIKAVLIPGLAFDIHGARLGHGGGWYDRALQAMPNALKIGVCFEAQIVDSVPQESHDIKMDFVVTETRVLKTKL